MYTRRETLRGGTAAVAAIAAAGAVAGAAVPAVANWQTPSVLPAAADEPLLALERQWLRQRHYANYEQPGETDEEREPAFEALDEIGDQIYETPAQSYAGVAVKLRMYARIEGFVDERTWWAHPSVGDDLALSALRDLERLAGGASS